MVFQNMVFPAISSRTRTMPFYVVSVGEKENQNHKIRENGYIAYQIAWCTKGKGVLILDGTQYEIDSGKGFYFAEGVPHEYYAAVQPWTLRWIAFNGNQTDYFFKFLKSPRGGVFKKKPYRQPRPAIPPAFIHSRPGRQLRGRRVLCGAAYADGRADTGGGRGEKQSQRPPQPDHFVFECKL